MNKDWRSKGVNGVKKEGKKRKNLASKFSREQQTRDVGSHALHPILTLITVNHFEQTLFF